MKKLIISLSTLGLIIVGLSQIGGNMNTVKISKTYKINSQKVWENWTDVRRISEFHPDLTSSPIIGKLNEGVGAKRKVTTTDGKELIHEIIALDEQNKSLSFTFKADFLPLKSAVCSIKVNAKSDSESEVHFQVDMEPKFGMLGWMLGKIVLEKKLAQGGHNLLNGLETYLNEH